MIKVIDLKNIRRIVLIIAVIILITAIIKYVYAKNKKEYKILVDVEDSKLFLIENNNVIKEYKCSGGKNTTPSPIGTWVITFKAKWGEGFRRKLYGT